MNNKDTGGEKGVTDEWISVNTWTMEYTMDAIERSLGEKFDPKNEAHMMLLKDLMWPYIYETMNLINIFDTSMVVTNSVLFYIYPDIYVDANGKAKDGYPSMVASSH